MDQRRPPGGLETLALIAVGGFLGSIARYGVVLLAPGLMGTFVVNVTGSAVLGFVFYTATTTDRISQRARLLAATGFLSSYTTYSMFAFETLEVDLIVGLTNVLGSYACGFGAALLGRRIALGGWR
jgi:fluoride exporter